LKFVMMVALLRSDSIEEYRKGLSLQLQPARATTHWRLLPP